MKLIQPSHKWQVQSFGRHDIYGPIRVSGAQAQAAIAEGNQSMRWAQDFAQAADTVTGVLMERYQASNEEEAQSIYNTAIGEIGEVESSVYNQDQFDMGSSRMEGIDYDDSKTIYNDDGSSDTINTGFAPTHEVGIKVWQTGVSNIMARAQAEGSNPVVQKAVASKLQQVIMQKNPAISGHVQKLARADKKAYVNNNIKESVMAGDTDGALNINEEAFKRGIIGRKEHDENVKDVMQQTDIQNFNENLNVTTDEGDLVTLSDEILFGENWMTAAQKATASKQALAKVDSLEAERKALEGEWHDNNEIDAVIQAEMNGLSKAELFKNKHLYSREAFLRLLKRTDKKEVVPTSNGEIYSEYDRRVSLMHFTATPGRPVDVQQKEILEEMGYSVLSGSLTTSDYNKFKGQMEDQNKEQFRAQPYREAKETLFVGILATLTPANVAQIENAGMNMSSFMLSAMGQDSNMAALAMGAFNDLNSYMRSSGSRADPLQWWEDNKSEYTKSKADIKNSNVFASRYPGDTIMGTGGAVDISATMRYLEKNYTGKELDDRAAMLKGIIRE